LFLWLFFALKILQPKSTTWSADLNKINIDLDSLALGTGASGSKNHAPTLKQIQQQKQLNVSSNAFTVLLIFGILIENSINNMFFVYFLVFFDYILSIINSYYWIILSNALGKLKLCF